jgi:hypothetical protein
VLLGLGLRSFHYLRDPPVWHDEAAQIYNILNKDFGDLLGPLFYSEACPPLFLALEKVVALVLGDGSLALRLIPFLASCLTLVVQVIVARRLLPRQAVLWFALLLGCSDRLLWHACEAKPYAVDVLTATGLFALWWHEGCAQAQGRLSPFLALCALLSPLLIFLSFPACFLLGGLALAVLADVVRGRRAAFSTYVAFVTVLGGAFVVLDLTAIQAQKNERIVSCWAEMFPSWHEPWLVPALVGWRLTEVARYTAVPAGNLLSVLAVVGCIRFWRGGQRRLVLFLTAPLALNVVAWLTHCYPLEASRVVVYAAPAVLLLIAAGIEPAWDWLRQRGRLAPLALPVLLLVPVGQGVLVVFKPWTRLDSASPVALVLERRERGEPVIGTTWEQGYYCRRLGPLYRTLATQPTEPPTLPATAALAADGTATTEPVQSLWLLSSPEPEVQASHLAQLRGVAAWRILEKYEFRDVVVLRLRR